MAPPLTSLFARDYLMTVCKSIFSVPGHQREHHSIGGGLEKREGVSRIMNNILPEVPTRMMNLDHGHIFGDSFKH